MARILGLDHGERRLGFALSDPTGMLATPLRVVHVTGEGDALRAVVDVCRETGAAALVIGLPRNMNGTLGPAAEKVARFIERLQGALTIPIHTWDERLSSRLVERVLIDADVSRAKRKGVIDKLAAQVILQAYLDAQSIPDNGGV